MFMERKVMDTKTKVFTVVMQSLFDICLIAYVITVVTNRYGTGVNIFAMLMMSFYGLGSFMWSKQRPESESKIIDTWSSFNGLLFGAMMVYEIVQVIL